MKIKSRSNQQRHLHRRASLLGRYVIGAILAAAFTSAGAESDDAAKEEKPKELTPGELFEGGTNTYNNWVEFSAGGFLTKGSRSSAEQNQRMSGSAFGGIEDLHLQEEVKKGTTFSLDGRALFDEHDYKLGLELRREKLGYVRFNYQEFRTWYDGAGGFYRPGSSWYPLPGNDGALGVDRGEFSFEAGLTLEKAPQVTFKYTHRFRDGDKSSTSWGQVRPGLVGPVRGLYPAVYDLDETADIFELNATHHIKATDFGLGVRFETGELNNTRRTTEFFGEPQQRNIADREGTSYDLLSVHTFSETWIKKNLLFSTGLLFANMNSDFSGSRSYEDFDPLTPPSGVGYRDLSGGAEMNEYVLNLNLMYLPWKNLTVVPSLRVHKEDWNANSGAFRTAGVTTTGFSDSTTDGDVLDVTERLDLNYTGLTNWVLFARGEWLQGDGNLTENGGIEQIAPVARKSEDSRNFQKYSVGARWYPARTVTLDFGGYYKINAYDYDHLTDNTPNNSANAYPAFLVMQDFETYDGNVRLTLRPLRTVTLVTRYEYQVSTIRTQPDAISTLGEVESSEMTSHIVGQNISWTPWTRLYFQAGINYVFSETKTPAADITQALLDAQNNYWTANLNAGLVLDEKTDLNLGYFYYRADNYRDNSAVSVPYGVGAEEHGITAMVTRRLTKNLRLNLKYGYYHYEDETSGGNSNNEAHLLYSSLQYRF